MQRHASPGALALTLHTADDWREVVRSLLAVVEEDFLAVVDGLNPDLLDRRLTPGSNSIGWLLWHLTRSHDRNMSEVSGHEQLWTAAGWAERFGRPPDPTDTGYRHTADDVQAFTSPEPAVLIAYHRAVVEMIDRYLDSAPADDFHRSSRSPTLGSQHSVGVRILAVLRDGLEHVGQAAFLRGLLSE